MLLPFQSFLGKDLLSGAGIRLLGLKFLAAVGKVTLPWLWSLWEDALPQWQLLLSLPDCWKMAFETRAFLGD